MGKKYYLLTINGHTGSVAVVKQFVAVDTKILSLKIFTER